MSKEMNWEGVPVLPKMFSKFAGARNRLNCRVGDRDGSGV